MYLATTGVHYCKASGRSLNLNKLRCTDKAMLISHVRISLDLTRRTNQPNHFFSEVKTDCTSPHLPIRLRSCKAKIVHNTAKRRGSLKSLYTNVHVGSQKSEGDPKHESERCEGQGRQCKPNAFLLDLFRHIGFSTKWISWVFILLSTAITKILLNGWPGQRICHARDLRQGDPI
jgi:hypothetical protein